MGGEGENGTKPHEKKLLEKPVPGPGPRLEPPGAQAENVEGKIDKE